jgi:hypothetical protein
MGNCAFTICAKNYLARALTLRESFLKNNGNVDFYIFLADLCDNEQIKNIPNLIQLSDSFIPKWEEMAFKYNIIEFSTSIKPFCVNYLFKLYEKVVYLDPDIYVLNSLSIIYKWLNDKDIIITPHYNNIALEYDGAITEEELLFVGIYNLGFCAIKNNETGVKFVNWWMNRLTNKCYADKYDALHVDQRWIDFLPAFFPNELMISRHFGLNVAIWNLHERELMLKNGIYLVRDIATGEIFDLIFFHFSGFNPNNYKIIHHLFPNYNINEYPVFNILAEDYRKKLKENNFELYSILKYSFDYFCNGEKILPLNRRLFRSLLKNDGYKNLFDNCGGLYCLLKKNNLISKIKQDKKNTIDNRKKTKIINAMKYFFRVLFVILGVDQYQHLLNAFLKISRQEEQIFLIKNYYKNKTLE